MKTVDDLVLTLQHLVDRVIRRFRLGPPPVRSGRRLLIVQIDGLSGSVLDLALAQRAMPFLAHLIDRRGHRRHDMSVGLPTFTPALPMAAMYGVRPHIPGVHYPDKRRRTHPYLPPSRD